MTEAEGEAIWHAISQYVENGECNDAVEDPYAADPHLHAAESVMRKLDAVVAAEPPPSRLVPCHDCGGDGLKAHSGSEHEYICCTCMGHGQLTREHAEALTGEGTMKKIVEVAQTPGMPVLHQTKRMADGKYVYEAVGGRFLVNWTRRQGARSTWTVTDTRDDRCARAETLADARVTIVDMLNRG